MKIKEKIETVNIYDLFDGRTLFNIIDLLTTKKMNAYKNNYNNLEFELEDKCWECGGCTELNIFGMREETQEEKEKRLVKQEKAKEHREKAKERRERAKRTKEEDEIALLKKLANKYNVTIE